jgi:hypothetical protein
MAIVSFKDEDGSVHFTDEFSKAYEKHVKAQAAKGEVKPAEKVEAPKPVVKPDVKSDPKAA